ncbi:MAG: ribose 5-phosphate isomerase A [Thermodesulfobacteriota bacterium]
MATPRKGQQSPEMNGVRKAASMAADFVSSGMVVGLGTGRAATFAIDDLASRVRAGQIQNVTFIPSSIATAAHAKSLGLKLAQFSRDSAIDITIDGADEVDRDFNVIKGGGGALLREKIVAQESLRNIVVVDKNKVSEKLGTRCRLPVEVVPFAVRPVQRFVLSLGAASMDLRRDEDGGIFKTDGKNYIIDCNFGPIYDLKIIAESLVWRAGIVEHGLFLTTTTDLMVSKPEGVEHLRAAQ